MAFMLGDAGISVLLTHAATAERLPEHRAQEVWLDEDWPVIGQQPGTAPGIALRAENLAGKIGTMPGGGSGTVPFPLFHPRAGVCTSMGGSPPAVRPPINPVPAPTPGPR